MEEQLRILEQLLSDGKNITVSRFAQTINIDSKSAIKVLQAFANANDGLTLLYIACYRDHEDNLVISQVPKDELIRLSAEFKDVQSEINAIIRGSPEDIKTFKQTSWSYDIELVKDKLAEHMNKNSLYIPSHANIHIKNLNIRTFETTPDENNTASSVTSSTDPTQLFEKDQFKRKSLFEADPQHLDSPTPTDTVEKSILAEGLKAKAVTDRTLLLDGKNKGQKKLKQRKKLSETLFTEKEKDLKATVDKKQADSSERPEIEKPIIDDKVKNDRFEPPEPPMASLFDFDDPDEPMELDHPESPADVPQSITYIEKVEKEKTYVEGGYFVVEDSEEYVQVTKEAPKNTGSKKDQGFTKRTSKKTECVPSSSGTKKRSKDFRQVTIKSFFGK